MEDISSVNHLINPITILGLLKLIIKWKTNKNTSHFICVSSVHSCMESYFNKDFKRVNNSADLAIADGRPIYWALKLLGNKKSQHLPGYYVTDEICKIAVKQELKIGFYGSTKKVIKKLSINLQKKHNGINIAFKHSPPFSKFYNRKESKILKLINKKDIDILFVCLGCPKQELWMYNNKDYLRCTMIGIGAAADYISGNKKQPNKFFEYLGLAWFIRLISEPKRLFWRYTSTNFLFIILIMMQLLGLKKFK